VHFSGPRKDRPLSLLIVLARPTLIESGAVRLREGRVQRALHGKQGLLEAANGGTRFLMNRRHARGSASQALRAFAGAVANVEAFGAGAARNRWRIIAGNESDLDSAIRPERSARICISG